MTDFPTDMCSDADSAPYVTNLVGHCKLCKGQWQIKSDSLADAKACPFCGAKSQSHTGRGGAVTIVSEAPDYGGAIIQN